jgi:hypothetical protein
MTMTMENLATTRTHSRKGIASFVIGVTSVISFLALIGTATVMTQTGKIAPPVQMIIGLGMFSTCFVDVIGIALGFLGAVDRASKKTYSVLGIVLNFGILVIFGALVIIGLSMKSH